MCITERSWRLLAKGAPLALSFPGLDQSTMFVDFVYHVEAGKLLVSNSSSLVIFIVDL
jgi:hypothetical protein